MQNTRRTTYYPLQGGEDLITPLYSRKPGTLVVSQNFECDSGGRYRRIGGYERYDGQTSPSDATYYLINFDAGETEVSEGDTVTGLSSSATGVALIDGVLESGSYAGNDATGHLILTEVSGTFQNDENLQVSAATTCVSNGTATERGASTSALDTTYIRDAVETARDNIAAIPGSGNVLGVWVYNDVKYGFRNNAGGTAAVMHKSSTSGWTEIDLGRILDFDAGTSEFTVGSTLTGGNSGATGVIKTVVVEAGTWAGNDADGYIVLSSVTDAFENNETITDAATGSATADGVDSAITLSPDGRYEFVNYNFTGHSGTVNMYGCDGVNNGFQFDGTTYTPIRTGMTSDTPIHINAHKKHLFLFFTGGSAQHSSLGVPLEWSAVTGASELGVGYEITGSMVMPNDTMAIFSREQITILYGTSVSDWALREFSKESGAYEWSVQRLSDAIFLDDGLSSLRTVQEYGDFKGDALSSIIQPLVSSKKNLLNASLRNKAKEQYRMYFSDGTGINLTFNGNKMTGFTRLCYDHTVECTCAGEDSSGGDIIFFGSDNGMVYQLDKGTSFDGAEIEAYFKASLNTIGSPERKKRFRKLVLERDDLQQEGEWGVGVWGNFKWGEQGDERDESYIAEVDTGYDYFYYSNSAYLESFTMQGIILHYIIGGLER